MKLWYGTPRDVDWWDTMPDEERQRSAAGEYMRFFIARVGDKIEDFVEYDRHGYHAAYESVNRPQVRGQAKRTIKTLPYGVYFETSLGTAGYMTLNGKTPAESEAEIMEDGGGQEEVRPADQT